MPNFLQSILPFFGKHFKLIGVLAIVGFLLFRVAKLAKQGKEKDEKIEIYEKAPDPIINDVIYYDSFMLERGKREALQEEHNTKMNIYNLRVDRKVERIKELENERPKIRKTPLTNDEILKALKEKGNEVTDTTIRD